MIMQTGTQRKRRAQRLRRLYEAAKRDGNEERFFDDLRRGLAEKQISPADFSIRSLFESFCEDGREIVDSWGPQNEGGQIALHEAGSAVETSAFTQITGQIVFETVLEAYQNPSLISDILSPPRDTRFDGEKVPGIGQIGDDVAVVDEGENYPRVGLTQEWIETPRTTKRGYIVPVTREAVFFDRTGVILDRARDTATWLAVNKEKRVLDVALGVTDAYNYKGNAITSYGNSSGNHDWDNLQASNALQDWSDIENALVLFDGITDPVTGEPVDVIGSLQLVVPSALLMTALRITGATEVRETTNTNTTSLSANPLSGQMVNGRPMAIEVVSNAYVKARTSSATTWFLGDFRRAHRYGQNWPITTVVAPPNSNDEFQSDIVQQFKVSERGAAEVHDPRRVVKCTA